MNRSTHIYAYLPFAFSYRPKLYIFSKSSETHQRLNLSVFSPDAAVSAWSIKSNDDNKLTY